MADIPRNRTLQWIAGIGAVLLVAGYLTADQWLSLLRALLVGA
jgi:hypothetical protein